MAEIRPTMAIAGRRRKSSACCAVYCRQIAAQGADLVQGYEGNQKSVDTLGAGKQLQKQYLGEGAGSSVTTPAAACPAAPTPFASRCLPSGRQSRSYYRENNSKLIKHN